MNVQFTDIESMIADLRRAKVKSIRLQATIYKKQITFENKNDIRFDVPYKGFEVIVTARVKDECWIYSRKIDFVNASEDKRRLNTAKKHMDEAEAEMRSLLEQNKFEIGAGAYYG